jgi:hypothetical protein
MYLINVENWNESRHVKMIGVMTHQDHFNDAFFFCVK